MDPRLLACVVCPVCYGKLQLDKEKNELICKMDKLAYPIDEGIPVLLEEKARTLTDDEK